MVKSSHICSSPSSYIEFIPIDNNLTLEYLPHLGSNLEMVPLHDAPPTNLDAPSNPSTNAADPSICSPHTSMQDTPSPRPLPPESSVSSNNENPLCPQAVISQFFMKFLYQITVARAFFFIFPSKIFKVD